MSLRVYRTSQRAAVPVETSPLSDVDETLEGNVSGAAGIGIARTVATETGVTETVIPEPASTDVPDREWANELRTIHGLSAKEAMERCRHRTRIEQEEREFQAFMDGASLFREDEQNIIDRDVKRQADQNTLLLTTRKLEEHERDKKRQDITIASGIICMNKYTAKSSRELEKCVKEVENHYVHNQLGYEVCKQMIAYTALSNDLRHQWTEYQVDLARTPTWADMKTWMESKVLPRHDQIYATLQQLDEDLQGETIPEAYFRKLRHIRENSPFTLPEDVWMAYARLKIPPGKRDWENIFNRNQAPDTLDKLESAAKGWSLSRPATSGAMTATMKRKQESYGEGLMQSAKRHHGPSGMNATGMTQRIEPPRPAAHNGDVVRDRRVEEIEYSNVARTRQPMEDTRKVADMRGSKCFKCSSDDGHWDRHCMAANCTICQSTDHTSDRHRETKPVTVADCTNDGQWKCSKFGVASQQQNPSSFQCLRPERRSA